MINLQTKIGFKLEGIVDFKKIDERLTFIKNLPIKTQFKGDKEGTFEVNVHGKYIEIIPSQEVDYLNLNEVDKKCVVSGLRGAIKVERILKEDREVYWFYTSPEDYKKYKI